MKILALELSSGQGSIAWREDDRETFYRAFANDRKHSGLFFENLQQCSREFGAPDAIVVGIGPGSYAGVRIAIATAVGLRVASAVKLVGIPSICAIDPAEREYCAVGDARRQSFFFARVNDGRLTEEPSLHGAAEVGQRILEVRVPVYTSAPLPQFPHVRLAYPSAQRLAELARDQIEEIPDSRALEPIYLREPHITVPKASPATAIDR
ncbi:MAG: tRNA (adenosine(37)-N6)-threonylcarbamoyltransferase complex dimerization subunit type 1 TsaB [Verrucomicrobiota bacterium]|nr:tRNA (adenosine(37)-N6)-threonylcarbamoyltransferase complex dimerization subunit type 1 TsaB [Verrucomicrobiota bacterium]